MSRQRRRRASAAAAGAAFLAVITALLPMTTLLVPTWFVPAVLAAGVVIVVGLLRRWAPVWVVVPLQVFAGIAACAPAFPLPLLGSFVPWPGAVWAPPAVFSAAVDQLIAASAPVVAGTSLSFALVVAVWVFALVVDLIAVTARLPLLALLPLAAVLVTPQLAVPSGDHLLLSVPFAAAALLLLAVTGPPRVRRRGRAAVWSTTAVVAVAAIAASVAVAPRLPVFPSADGVNDPSIADVSLSLGDDLRNTSSAEVMRVRTTEQSAPYLRLATHTGFDDDGWRLDVDGFVRPLSHGLGDFEAPSITGEEAVSTSRTWISDIGLDIGYLPVPQNAVEVAGAEPGWRAELDNRTVSSEQLAAEGEAYSVEARVVSPTTEQLNASPWPGSADAILGGQFDEERTPAVGAALEIGDDVADGTIGETAGEVTEGDGTPYQAALSLQRWLRSSAFSYSLQTPVNEGFDGSDLAAVEAFLEVREGYCQHFASAFALMARSLGIPTRIVVGYLPGEDTGETVGEREVYSVAADRLHAWPEVYLLGIGWVQFDPTPSIASAQTGVDETEEETTDEPEQDEEQAASPEPTEIPTETEEPDAEATGSEQTGSGATGMIAGLGALLALLVLLFVPRLVRGSRRSRRIRAARAGDATAAWRETVATAIDAGWEVAASESPRAFGDRMIDAGTDPAATGALVAAIERASFARETASGADLAGAVRAFARSIPAERRRGRAGRWLMPRSLWTRPRLVEAGRDG
ncbi:transglutaminaseTgpA domain-containing protein [Microbacterium halotolerans]|uniref:transglutaminase family protein n=1 Tax=Microbacterium halotolerans TaxID=246613 RepID=UPI000E6AC768|nr:DUF3488 and transglutaminase-like domain-containing protein [Microbacterium halotolerans]